MSCNTKTSLAAVIDAVNAQLNNNYVDRDDPRIDQGVFTEPTIRGGLMLDEAAKLDFCGYVTECGQREPFGKQWVDRPLYPYNTLVSYEDEGEIKSRWQDIDDVVAGTEIGESYIAYEETRSLGLQGYTIIDSFELGETITQRDQALRHAATGKSYRWAGDLPKVVPASSTPENSGGFGSNAWLEVSDITFSQELLTGGAITDTIVTVTPNGVGKVARTQMDKNSDTVTPYDFGLIGGYSTLTLGDKYTTLIEAQEVYPQALALTELHDRVVFDTFLRYITANNVRSANWSCELLLDQPLFSLKSAKTTLIEGDLNLKSYNTDLNYCLHLATRYLVVTGKVTVYGTQTDENDLTTRKVVHGVVSGSVPYLGLSGNGSNARIGQIIGNNIIGYAHYLGADCHFSNFGQVRGSYCGSFSKHASKPLLQGLSEAFTVTGTTGRGDTNSGSVLSIAGMKYSSRMHSTGNARAIISGQPYDIVATDFSNESLTVYPQLPSSVSSGEILFIFGGAVTVTSNNTACCTYDTIESIICGYALDISSLYGVAVNSLIAEYSGIGIGVRWRKLAHLGTVINQGYFESTKQDIIYGWSMSDYNCLTINQSVGLNTNKIWNMYAYLYGANDVRRNDWSQMGLSTLAVAGEVLTLDTGMSEITSDNHNRVRRYGTSPSTWNFSFNHKRAQLTGRTSKFWFMSAPDNATNTIITVSPPTGYTVNGKESELIPLSDYIGTVTVTLQGSIDYNSKNISLVYSGTRKAKSGTTEQRPTSPLKGDVYYDTTLAAGGKPISWSGTTWVDYLGESV